MFNKDFWPTPPEVASRMLEVIEVKGKKILEPSAGSGNLVKALQAAGATVWACENDPNLRLIAASLCPLIGSDFMQMSGDQISHIQAIVMNPPFSRGWQHITHAWEIAPPGCEIVALCNSETLENDYHSRREGLKYQITHNGYAEKWGQCFSSAERATGVEVTMIYLKKPAADYETEFEGFFTEEVDEIQAEGMMPYNAIRDVVNRYVAAVKLYDTQIQSAVQMAGLINIFPESYRENGNQETPQYVAFKADEASKNRDFFKSSLQKRAWQYLFDKMDIRKYATAGLKEDINKFVEQQKGVPFTMRNVYRMFEIVIGTAGSRMDKALLEVFDKLTQHYSENRFFVEGWKTNSHYLVNRKFILPGTFEMTYGGKMGLRTYGGWAHGELLMDMAKALCFMEGKDYNNYTDLRELTQGKYYYEEGQKITVPGKSFGEWFIWEPFFRIKGFKKGTAHVEFLDENVWHRFNKNIARIKGYPLPEQHSTRKAYTGSYQTV